MAKIFYLILLILGLVITTIWYLKTKELEPLGGIIVALAGIIYFVFIDNDKGSGSKFTFNQKGGKNARFYNAKKIKVGK